MTREGAVKGLLEVADWHYGKYEQTHEEDYLDDGDFLTAVANLLKAQEPVEPIYDGVHRCRICYRQVDRCCDNYCPNCGQAVKWE